MKVEISKNSVKNLKISEIANLDLVNVYLENIEPGKGRILIECYGKSWTAYWGAMSGLTIQAFFVKADNSYITDRLDYKAKGRYLKYLTRIVEAVKEALQQIDNSKEWLIEAKR